MIFHCPNCDKKYLLSASVLGADGRMVRCVACAHEWFQEPERNVSDYNQPDEPEEVEEEIEDESVEVAPDLEEWDDEEDEVTSAPFEPEAEEVEEETEEVVPVDEDELDIPKGVQPIQEGETKPQAPAENVKPEEPLADKMMGFGAALAIFFVLLVGALIGKNSIINAWPPSSAIYNLAGFSTPVKGEGLIIDSLKAEMDSNGKIILRGSVLNSKDKDVEVPKMRALFKLDDVDPDNQWIIDPPVQTLAAGDNFTFASSYDNPPEDVSIINLSFISEQ